MDGDDSPIVPPSGSGPGISSMRGWNPPKPADLADERRRRYRIAATAMETAAIPPTTPPTIGPVFELLPFAAAVAVEALAEDVYTPGAPKMAPGPYSG